MNIVYGYTVANEDDAYIALAEACAQALSHASVFGTYLVDYIPILKYVPSWIPGVSFKRKAREWRILASERIERPFKTVKENMVSETL
jgi:hypothetical protein